MTLARDPNYFPQDTDSPGETMDLREAVRIIDAADLQGVVDRGLFSLDEQHAIELMLAACSSLLHLGDIMALLPDRSEM